MQGSGFSIRHWLTFVLWLVLGSTALAQNTDSGDYQILEARYGTAERNIDVTERLRELARLDRSFRMGNDTFGTDPDPGRRKVLRIYTRARDGQLRTFEFSEGSVVDGAQFTGWSAGQWGRGTRGTGWNDGFGNPRDVDEGENRILQAFYGTAERNVDVTQRLRELAAQDRDFRADNATLGVDPHPGRLKTLRIYTQVRGGGAPRLFEFREGSVVDGTQFSGWRSGNWGHGPRLGGWAGGLVTPTLAIVHAAYGNGSQRIDVSDRLRAQLHGDRVDLTVDNAWAGGDPAPGVRKTLWVIYTLGGRVQYAEVRESERLSIGH